AGRSPSAQGQPSQPQPPLHPILRTLPWYYPNIPSSTQNGKDLTHRGISFSFPEVMCPRPPNIANGLHSGQTLNKFSRGLTIYYGCKDGYELFGNMSIYCMEAGVWSRPLPRCEGGWMLHCSLWGWRKGYWMSRRNSADRMLSTFPTAIGCEIPEVQNGKIYGLQSTYKAGETLHFDCISGYATDGSYETQCQPGGTWDPPVPTCEKGEFRPCPPPLEITNGNHSGQGKSVFTAGMRVTYTCNPSYHLVGNPVVFCRASGNWSQPSPRCEEAPSVSSALRLSPCLMCRRFQLSCLSSIGCPRHSHGLFVSPSRADVPSATEHCQRAAQRTDFEQVFPGSNGLLWLQGWLQAGREHVHLLHGGRGVEPAPAPLRRWVDASLLAVGLAERILDVP
uniref:Sushi domain-containing protein n=1 Tax=Falco tinnunculus TaxID=100819 RepID=A0A8C4TUS1_FALTI